MISLARLVAEAMRREVLGREELDRRDDVVEVTVTVHVAPQSRVIRAVRCQVVTKKELTGS